MNRWMLIVFPFFGGFGALIGRFLSGGSLNDMTDAAAFSIIGASGVITAFWRTLRGKDLEDRTDV